VSKELKQRLSSGHEITLDKSYYVDAQMKNSDRWFRARILDCKLSKGKVTLRGQLTAFLFLPLLCYYRL
jgi:hypothetical protein